jgi:hypothetical protein
MPRKTRNTRWVIFASPQHPLGGANVYIATDGKPTRDLRLAANLFTHASAVDFAEAKSITLDGAMKYADQVDWPSKL